jgi:hypothetical protein
MIRVVVFELAATLVDAKGRAFPHVAGALDAIGAFVAADGKPLQTCLVADAAQLADVAALLDGAGLRAAFEPFARRVTASAELPDRAAFEAALRRLRVRATLEQCLFVSGNAAHATAARKLGMAVLAVGRGRDFHDWSQAPALVAQRVAPEREANLQAAITAHLAARDVAVASVGSPRADGTRTVSARVWHTLPAQNDVESQRVAVPVSATVATLADGSLRARVPKPDAEAIAEAANYARSLAERGQIAPAGRAPRGEETHTTETDTDGRPRLVRRRFTAI